MNIDLSISQAPGITTNYLISTIYEANPDGSIGPLVTSQAFAAPHTSPRNVTFTGLDVNVYVHVLWENTTSSPGGTNRGQFIYDPQYGNSTIEVRADLFLTVDDTVDDPVSGETVYTRADLNEWDYSIERRGGGTMSDTEVSVSTDRETITLLGTVSPFVSGEIFVLHFIPKLVTNNPIAVTNSGKIFSNSDIITTDTTLGATDIGKVKVLQGAATTLEVTLPALADISVNRMICIISEGGNHINAKILAAGADEINFGGTVTSIIMGQSERLWLYKSLDQTSLPVWEVAICQGKFHQVGEVFQSYRVDEENAVFCDGDEYDRAEYPRLWAYIQTLHASAVVNDADWSNVALNNKGKFSSGDGSTTFRVPQLYTGGFLRGVDGSTRRAGAFQDHAMLTHQHEGTSGTLPTTLFGRGIISRLLGLYNGSANNYTDMTSTPKKSDGTDVTNLDTETRPVNIGIYFMIRT